MVVDYPSRVATSRSSHFGAESGRRTRSRILRFERPQLNHYCRPFVHALSRTSHKMKAVWCNGKDRRIRMVENRSAPAHGPKSVLTGPGAGPTTYSQPT